MISREISYQKDNPHLVEEVVERGIHASETVSPGLMEFAGWKKERKNM